jgi:hypothetical protein
MSAPSDAMADAVEPCVGEHCCCCGPGDTCCDCGEIMPDWEAKAKEFAEVAMGNAARIGELETELAAHRLAHTPAQPAGAEREAAVKLIETRPTKLVRATVDETICTCGSPYFDLGTHAEVCPALRAVDASPGWVPAGWKLVPVEADDNMVAAGLGATGNLHPAEAYRQMLAAAPATPDSAPNVQALVEAALRKAIADAIGKLINEPRGRQMCMASSAYVTAQIAATEAVSSALASIQTASGEVKP